MTRREARLLDEAHRIILQLDAAEAATADMEPEEDDDTPDEGSLQALTLCPDWKRPVRGRLAEARA